MLTVACYRSEASAIVDKIIDIGGHVRLVKGYYCDYDVDDWSKVGDIFEENARKLARSSNWHTLATHDFDILKRIFTDEPVAHIEVSHFCHARWYVEHEMQSFPIDITHKSFYVGKLRARVSFTLGDECRSFRSIRCPMTTLRQYVKWQQKWQNGRLPCPLFSYHAIWSVQCFKLFLKT